MRKVHLWLHTLFCIDSETSQRVFFPMSPHTTADLLFRLAWFLRAPFALLRPITSSLAFSPGI